MNDQVKFPKSEFANVSQDAEDFIKACLVKDPKTRPYIKDIISHPWITGIKDGVVTKDVQLKAAQNIRTFK